MAITILVFMASMGTWWIVPCVGFHLHMRAPCKCNSLSSMRTESAWMNLNEGVSLLQCLTSDICVYYTDTLPSPHGLLTHSAGKFPPRVFFHFFCTVSVSQHLNTLIGRFDCAIALSLWMLKNCLTLFEFRLENHSPEVTSLNLDNCGGEQSLPPWMLNGTFDFSRWRVLFDIAILLPPVF